jgi:hypothetical protein
MVYKLVSPIVGKRGKSANLPVLNYNKLPVHLMIQNKFFRRRSQISLLQNFDMLRVTFGARGAQH